MITSSCCERWLPSQTVSSRLDPSEPTMAPSVLAAYTPPTTRAGSSSSEATDASASGKLAPQRIAPGRTTHRQRTKSSWKLNHGSVVIDGFTGQYGIDCVSIADQAIAAQMNI